MERVRKLKKSFIYAIRGIRFCIRHERNIRIHITATLYVLYFSQFYGFSRAETALLLLLCGLVISMEIMNTAIEVVIDKVSHGYNVFAMIGKDIAAGAVLVTAATAVAVGVVMMWDTEVFGIIFRHFAENPWNAALFAASIVMSLIFIGSVKKRGGNNKALK